MHTYEVKLKLLHKIFFGLLVFGLLFSQSSLSNTELEQLIKQSGLSENDMKNLIQNENFESLIPKNSNQLNLEDPIDSDLSNDSKEIVLEVINSNSSLNEEQITSESENSFEKVDSILVEKKIDEIEALENEEGESSLYYGYSTFFNDPDFFQKSSDFGIPPSYNIGPGDEIIIMLWGDTEDVSEYTVSREGYIFIPNIGRVFVNGLNLSGLEKKLKKILQKAYSSISENDSFSSTFFDVSLGSVILKPIRVFVMGEVSKPGVYEMKPSSSIFTSLYYFNGPKVSGTLRDIKLIRKGKEFGSIDFYDFLLTGEKNNDIQLQDNDVIFIAPRQKSVKIQGEVFRESIFELKSDESYFDLEKIFGGYLSTTYTKRVRLDRTMPIEKRISSDKQYEIIDLDLNNITLGKKEFQIFDGDVFTFYKIGNKSDKIVTISGPVKRPGEYSIGKKLTISGLINKADGLINEDVFRSRVDLIRQSNDGTKSFISVNLDSVLMNFKDHNLQLETDDNLVIYKFSDMIFTENVTIEGFVLNPGEKQFQEGMTVFDLLFLGGGFENSEHLQDCYLERADLLRKKDNGNSEFELISFNLDSVLAGHSIADQKIQMGDKITVFSKTDVLGFVPQTVEISGYVKNPGVYTLAKNMKLSDLIFMGFGIKDDIYSNDIMLRRADYIKNNNVNSQKTLIKIDLKKLIDDGINNYDLSAGDRVIFYSKDLFRLSEESVTINGYVNQPGTYEMHENMNLGDVILMSNGIIDREKNIKAEISRFKNDNGDVHTIFLDVKNDIELFTNNKSSVLNFALENNDLINIFSERKSEFRLISIEGEIKFPGQYVLNGEGEDLFSIVERSGGLSKNANPISVSVLRDDKTINLNLRKVLSSKKSRHNIALMADDVINIAKKSNIVTVIGAVNTPGVYQYIKGQSVKDYIDLAGGYSKNADRLNTFVRHANGSSEKVSLFNKNLRVFDSSNIEVLDKGVVEPFSMTTYVSSLTEIYSDLLQAIAVISILSQQN
jgi:polysaccharide biosynthesis/export protein